MIVPVRNPIEELWPSPMARTLMTNRTLPGLTPVWSGCITMLGLQRAAPSMAYSLVKVAPSSRRRVGDSWQFRVEAIGELVGVPEERFGQAVMSTRRTARSRRRKLR